MEYIADIHVICDIVIKPGRWYLFVTTTHSLGDKINIMLLETFTN